MEGSVKELVFLNIHSSFPKWMNGGKTVSEEEGTVDNGSSYRHTAFIDVCRFAADDVSVSEVFIHFLASAIKSWFCIKASVDTQLTDHFAQRHLFKRSN